MEAQTIINLVQDVGASAAAVGLALGYLEYLRQGRQRRAEKYFELVRSFAQFDQVIDLLRTDSPKLRRLKAGDKERFLGFYEDLALLIHSDLIQEDLAIYAFGYWLDRVWESKHFWADPKNRDDAYWFLMRQLHFRIQARSGKLTAFLKQHDRSEAYGRVRRTFRF
jgi:hypothetical protein